MVYGMIMNWFGEAEDIPPGFAICDGNNGTPDLRDKFIVSAGGTYGPGDTGGYVQHSHSFTGDGHFHTLTMAPTFLAAGTYRNKVSDTRYVTGDTNQSGNLPPYHALLFIMYIGL